MTTDNIALARECGARVLINGIEPHVTFSNSQLSQFVQRIRSEALEEAAKRMEELHKGQEKQTWHNLFLIGAAHIRALDRLGGDGETR